MEEKMMILKMVQEGKISTDEAVKLLDALEKTNAKETTNETGKFRKKVDINFDEFTAKAEKAAEHFESNSEKFAEDFAKRIENVSTDIASSAVRFADKMMKHFNATVNTNENKFELTKTYTFDVGVPEEVELNISTSNFHVNIESGEVNQIQVNVLANSFMQDVNIDDCFKGVVDGSKYDFICQFPNRTWGKIDITVPKVIKNINLLTSNAKCELSNINLDYIKAVTSNAKIELTSANAKTIEAMTDNSRIHFENCLVSDLSIRTSNGKIEINRSKIDNITAKTSNGAIQIDGIEKLTERYGKYNLYTSNGKIDVKLSPTNDYGYMVDAHTTMGNVNIKLPGLIYSVDKKNLFSQPSTIVKNECYEESQNKLDIKADTSNALINVQG